MAPHDQAARAHGDDILRLSASIKQGTVAAPVILCKLGSNPRQNGLTIALHELRRASGFNLLAAAIT